MFKIVLNTVFVLFMGAIVGIVTGFVITTITGFVFFTIAGGIYPTPTDLEELGANLLWSAFLFGSFGVIVGFTTGVGVALMGIRPHASIIWPLITGTSMFLGGWIGKEFWWQDIVVLILIAISSAIAVWTVVRLIERILSKRLNGGENTPWVICGYIVVFALMALVTPVLLSYETYLLNVLW